MHISNSKYEEMLEEYIKSESLQEKIKFYLEVYVLNRGGNLLDQARCMMHFSLGLENKRHHLLLPLDKRIEVMSLLLTRYMSEEEVNCELRKMPPESAKNANEFINEYCEQLELMKQVQSTSKH